MAIARGVIFDDSTPTPVFFAKSAQRIDSRSVGEMLVYVECVTL